MAADHDKNNWADTAFELYPLREQDSQSTNALLYHHKEDRRSRQWPSLPGPVKSSKTSIVLEILTDIIFACFSLAFFAFALTVRSYDGAATREHQRLTSALQEASRYGPSVFPILFACVVGRAAQAILQWRLERGARVGYLDTLAGSTSFTSAVTTQFKLRVASFLGLGLLLVWTLSPIGGQASLRQMAFGNASTSEPAMFTYMIPGKNLSGYAQSSRQSDLSVANTLFLASIIAPTATKHSTLDTWGNVRIPMIEPYEQTRALEEHGWFNVSGDAQGAYSSLVGIPILGTSKSASNDHSLKVETSYFHLVCPTVNGSNYHENITSLLSPLAQLPEGVGDGALMFSTDNSSQRALADPSELKPRKFTYWTWGNTGISTCTVSTTYVEADILCAASTPCAVSRMRRSQQVHPPPGFTVLDIEASGSTWDRFTDAFTTSAGGHPATDTVVQDYLVEPDDPLAVYRQLFYGYKAPPYSNEDIALRLGQLMNTYWACLTGMYAISGGMSPATAWMEGTNASTANYLLANSDTVTGTTTTWYAVIVAQHGWIVALSIASIIMVVASLARPIVHFFLTTGPEVALNYSSLALRDNPYVDVPSACGTHLAASDRARLARDLRVQLRDVEVDAHIGRLAIACIDEKDHRDGRSGVRKGRLYM